MVLGFLSDLPIFDTYFNRSLPIIPYTSNFEIIGNDPRPIAEDLTRISSQNIIGIRLIL
jgi:hypothetical protein